MGKLGSVQVAEYSEYFWPRYRGSIRQVQPTTPRLPRFVWAGDMRSHNQLPTI